jgi:hypothetical protein
MKHPKAAYSNVFFERDLFAFSGEEGATIIGNPGIFFFHQGAVAGNRSKTTDFRSSRSLVRPFIPDSPLEFHAVNAAKDGASFLTFSPYLRNFSAIRRVGAFPLGLFCRFLNNRCQFVGYCVGGLQEHPGRLPAPGCR